jgi:hypothetical protein
VKSTCLIKTVCILVCSFVIDALPVVAIDFEVDIKPLLESRCLSCHNPNNKKGDLSLSTADEGNAFSADLFTFDQTKEPLLLAVVTSSNGNPPEMPKKREPLNSEDVETLREWIKEGAQWPSGMVLRETSKATDGWWAYQPLTPTDQFKETSVDAFIEISLDEKGLERNPQADKRTLIRRATYDLTGLPPTPAEVHEFIDDTDSNAYERLLDRLLASPRYGERWGRHWLDVVRFGESNGFERNVIINDLWPFRDYVIDSINRDKPFDQFIREHLAGDVIGKGQPEVEIASAFLVAGPYDDVGNQDPAQAAQIRANTIDEMIRTTSEAFLGMTVGCARCHDHKFDPIAQADYYRLYATLSGIRHGSVPWATQKEKIEREKKLAPLDLQKKELEKKVSDIDQEILARAKKNASTHEAPWIRSKILRTGIEDTFPIVNAKHVRLVSEGQDTNPKNTRNFNIDEFEIWSAGTTTQNVALSKNGGKAFGEARQIEDFADAYNAELAIDGQFGARYIATGGILTIELPEPTKINRVYFSSARGASVPDQRKFGFVGEYRIEISLDGESWKTVATSHDREPVNEAFRDHRFRQLEITSRERNQVKKLRKELAEMNRKIRSIPRIKTAFIGRRSEEDAKGPFHIFQGGSPQRKGTEVFPASLSTLENVTPSFELKDAPPEQDRRLAFANWLTHPKNPLPARVLANRLWHYHFGTGIVDTPSDFGYMGGRPSHPELLDFLAQNLIKGGWRLKPLHKLIMLSKAYQQSSAWDASAARLDADSRLLWRFPPRRLSAEEIRDTILHVAGKLDLEAGGPGFRLYKFMQDNVSTYDPLNHHGPETYRRAVFHQNVRASVVDLMTEFDLPDCAFSSPRRAGTTTPLQALTLLNHSFTIDMAESLGKRLESFGKPDDQVTLAFQLAYQRPPSPDELSSAGAVIKAHGLRAFCRALLNANELIYLD